MLWYQLLVPAVGIAALVRAEALLIGPYWAWIELLPWFEDETTRRARRLALVRRTTIPAAAAFCLTTAWRDTYSTADAVLVGATSAGLLLWPALMHGLPWGVRARDWEVATIYTALFVTFSASAWLGATGASWITDEYGSFGSFIRQEATSFLFMTIVAAFGVGILDNISSRASGRDDDTG